MSFQASPVRPSDYYSQEHPNVTRVGFNRARKVADAFLPAACESGPLPCDAKSVHLVCLLAEGVAALGNLRAKTGETNLRWPSRGRCRRMLLSSCLTKP
jgi:hypothetical protein